MKFFKRICRALLRSKYTFLVCGAVAITAVIYSGCTAKDMIEGREAGEWNFQRIDPIVPEDMIYIPEILTQEDAEEDREETTCLFTDITIDLPEATPPEQVESEITQQETTAPETTQKPTQTTRPPEQSTQRPTTQGTTKPPQSTQKPSESTTGGTSKPVSGWNVTYAQAKKMVKADSAYDYEDLYWLARIISAEAKGESFTGQIGVGTVVLNRVRSTEFPNTVKGVVFDRKYGTQFTPVANGTVYNTPTNSAVVAAKMCLDGYTLSNSVLYFVNPSIATSSWIQNHRKYAFRIGNHEFYH